MDRKTTAEMAMDDVKLIKSVIERTRQDFQKYPFILWELGF